MLDFYLLGLARSGTSAFVRALNLHPNIYCGLERFTIQTDPSLIKFPESFLDASLKGNTLGFKHAYETLLVNPNIDKFMVVGEKLPRKFYCPSHLDKPRNNILIYRSYKNATQSWDARADNNKDMTWDDHRTGIFFFWDLLIFFNGLPLSTNMAVVNFDELYFGDYRKELSAVFQTLGLPDKDYPFHLFEEQLHSQKKQYVKECHNDRYNAVAKHIKLTAFEDDFFNAEVSRRLDIVKEYADFLKKNASVFFDFLLDLIEPEKEEKELFSVLTLIVNNFRPKDLSDFFPEKTSRIKHILSLFEKDSEDNLSKICELFPICAWPHYKLSRIYAQNNEVAKAIAEVQKAIDLKGEDPNFHNHLGGLLMRAGDLDGAEKCQKRAIDIDPDIPVFHMQLSHVYARKNEVANAIEEAAKAIALKGDNPNFHNHLGGLLMKAGDLDGAEKCQKRAIDIDPDIPLFHIQLSHVYGRKNELDKAIEEAHKAVELKGDDPNFRNHLGALLKRAGSL